MNNIAKLHDSIESHIKRKQVILRFHAGCPDGIGGVFPFWRKYKQDYITNNLQIVGARHYDTPNISQMKDKIVVMIDYCDSILVLLDICKVAKSVYILDHHDTTLRTRNILDNMYSPDIEWSTDDLQTIIDVKQCIRGYNINYFYDKITWFLDMSRSGAQIAWDCVYPQIPRPWFIEIIADRDLWKWSIEDSKPIGKALYHYDYYKWEVMEALCDQDEKYRVALRSTETRQMNRLSFKTMQIVKILSDEPNTNGLVFGICDKYKGWFDLSDTISVREESIKSILADKGNVLLESEQRDIDYHASRAIRAHFCGYNVKIANCPANLRSEVGNVIAGDDCDFAVMWRYDFLEDQWWLSMRANDPDINLAKIAEKFGGGGHPPAAAFTIHGSRSIKWLESDSKARMKMAHGNLHDYFVIRN